MKYDIQHIKRKRKQLSDAAAYLKTIFVGIDDIIDSVIQNMETWYVTPELLVRPVIINLWGMTGVGKTDLIRKLISFLKINEFCEVSMDSSSGGDDYDYISYIRDILRSSLIKTGTPGVLLLDEFQRYRCKNDDGEPITQNKFTDVWTLLSDGKFGNNGMIKRRLWDLYYSQKHETWFKGEKNKKLEYRTALDYLDMLGTDMSIDDMMKLTYKEIHELIGQRIKDFVPYEPDYTKLLIFICGNLDEAYTSAYEVENCDVDADVLYESSTHINILDIKACLTRRFFPEQISRFGNNHVIYPSMNKHSYKELIRRTVNKHIIEIKNNTGYTVEPFGNFYDVIYRNSVFPAQGVRPVFSSIMTVFVDYIPKIILTMVNKKIKDTETIFIQYGNNTIECYVRGKKICEFYVNLILDSIVKEKHIDEKALQAVHEAGHACVMALVTGFAPTHIKINTGNSPFVLMNINCYTKNDYIDRLYCLVAGHCAEQIVFEGSVSNGWEEDLELATELMCKFVRTDGFSNRTATIRSDSESKSYKYVTNMDPTNDMIEAYIRDAITATTSILQHNTEFLTKVSRYLIDHGELKADTFVELFGEYVPQLKPYPDGYAFNTYNDMFIEFEKKLKE